MTFNYTKPINKSPIKVVAIFDKPANCGECPCSYFTEGCHHDFCQLKGYETNIEDFETTGVPEWCPLIEVEVK